jgi:hypothetical protein
MNGQRIRSAAAAAVAALLVGGAAAVFAASPSPATTEQPQAPSEQVQLVAPSSNPAAPETQETPETRETPETGEPRNVEADGPGGHQDPDGQNVDHQFEGQE